MQQTVGPAGAMADSEILVAQGLKKAFGRRKALQGLTFSLKAGHILGFLGPNGAGKTTTIRILTTMLEPDEGYFLIDGIRSEYPDQIRRRIGVLPENLGFPLQMSGLAYLLYFGQLYGRTAAEAKDRALVLLRDVGLQQRVESPIGSYSHGMRQRLGIARALINDPTVVFLDEPTQGLDLRGQRELLELIKSLAHERCTGVVLCSHMISEIEEVCDDVVIMDLGHIVARGSVSGVIGRVQKHIVLRNAIRIHVLPESVEQAVVILNEIPNILQITPIGEMDGWLRLELLPANDGKLSESYRINNHILQALLRGGIPVLGLEVEGGRLQDVYLHLTEEAIR